MSQSPDTIPAPESVVTEADIADDRPTLVGGEGYEAWVLEMEDSGGHHERPWPSRF